MKSPLDGFPAPRPPPAGAPVRTARRRLAWVSCAVTALLVPGPREVRAQQPSDTLVADTLPPVVFPEDSLAVLDDTLADTLRVVNLPRLPRAPSLGWETATWTLDRAAIMGSRDLTLLELLESIPGVIPLRGGDYGAPEAASAMGLAAGRVRIFLEGMELLPLDGGVADLGLVSLAGIEEIHVERGPGELRIHLESLRVEDPRSLSLVEAGTGELDTNLFRGTFVAPRALRGSFGLALERLDTRGSGAQETGSRTAWWLRYGVLPGERYGVLAELRGSSREIGVDVYPGKLTRTDWTVRARARLGATLTTELFTSGSSLKSDGSAELIPIRRSRSQHGVRMGWERADLWASGVLRTFGGPDLPSRSLELEAGATLGYGGVHGRWSSDSWAGEAASTTMARAWTTVAGFSLFASWEDGRRGAVIYPPRQPEPSTEPAEGEEPPAEPEASSRLTDARTFRAGASFRWRGFRIGGAWMSFEVDSLPPLGTELDRAGGVEEGGKRTGWEGTAEVPLPVDGFALVGTYQTWDEEARYLPARLYSGGIRFHDVFLDTGNFELWGELGVRGHDPMRVPLARDFDQLEQEGSFATVPFHQNWYIDIQARIVSLSLFIRWENVMVRQNLQNFPGRVLPATRGFYGIRWKLWN